MVSRVGMGGIPIQRPPFDEAVEFVQEAIDLGINFFDTSIGYHDSELRIGEGVEGHRDDVIVATKGSWRNKESAAEHDVGFIGRKPFAGGRLTDPSLAINYVRHGQLRRPLEPPAQDGWNRLSSDQWRLEESRPHGHRWRRGLPPRRRRPVERACSSIEHRSQVQPSSRHLLLLNFPSS
jgi:aryl-alcohol dehydrogenase-like predicted oxidoreductase